MGERRHARHYFPRGSVGEGEGRIGEWVQNRCVAVSRLRNLEFVVLLGANDGGARRLEHRQRTWAGMRTGGRAGSERQLCSVRRSATMASELSAGAGRRQSTVVALTVGGCGAKCTLAAGAGQGKPRTRTVQHSNVPMPGTADRRQRACCG